MLKPGMLARRAFATLLTYGLACVSVAVALLVTLLLRPDELVTPVFFLAIMLSAWLGGIGPGLLAALWATLGVDYFFLQPLYTLKFDPANVPHLLVFFLSAMLVSSWSATRKRAETLLRRARDEQEAQVQERTADLNQANAMLRAEIAERRRVAETLRERADLLDLTHDTVFVRDMRDVITYWNRGAAERYGWQKAEAVGQVSHDLLRTIFPTPLDEIHAALLGTGRWEGELVHTKRDGTQVVVASRWSIQWDEQGNSVAILETNNDITERKRAEEELEQTEQRLRTVIANAPIILFALDRAGVCTLSEGRGLDTLGLTPGQAVGQSVFEVYHGMSQVLSNVRRALAGEPFTDVVEVNDLVFEIHFIPLLDQRGAVVGVNGVAMNITERKRAEEELRESARRYRSIFEGAGVSLWVEDFSRVKAAMDDLKARGVRDFRQYLAAHPEFIRQAIAMVKLVDVNDVTVKLFAAESKDELRVSLDSIFLPETEDVFAGELVALSEGRPSFESETVLRTLKGDRLTVLFTIAFPPDPTQWASVLVSIMDITERKRAEEALHKAQAELAHVTRVTTMGALVASIAHEINQPLAAIVTNGSACLRWLAEEAPNLDEIRDAVYCIIDDGQRASAIVTRIRALLRKTAFEQTRLDLHHIVHEVIRLTQHEMGRQGVTLRLALAADLPPVVGDRVQVQQVLLNLVMNGLEAMAAVTERPRELVIHTRQEASDTVLVAVQDSGMGLDRQHLDEIFTAFYTTKAQGLGMGLAISRAIVEQHGGQLWAVPHDGPGATFQLTLVADHEEGNG